MGETIGTAAAGTLAGAAAGASLTNWAEHPEEE